MSQEIFTIDEAMAYLRVSRSTIYRLMRDGDLPFYVLIKGGRRLKKKDMDRLLVRGSPEEIEELSENSGS
jgi:excisionase family DNA binding protein